MSRNMVHIPVSGIENKIHQIRGHRVLLDSDLALLYEVSTKQLNQAVKRNPNRFPPDFMFQLTYQELTNLRSQFVTLSLKQEWGKHNKYLPHAFTEQGIAMLSSVLKSERAAQVNVSIMRAFIKFRQFLLTHEELARKLAKLEQKYDAQFKIVFEAIRKLMPQPEAAPVERKRIRGLSRS